ncbi:hypothetical protein PHG01_01350 [Streptococcus mutans PKUSS-HG01]|nr:hypothetical protein PHG01_01350 [Streptococcus mutans PKUSS-HG01]
MMLQIIFHISLGIKNKILMKVFINNPFYACHKTQDDRQKQELSDIHLTF